MVQYRCAECSGRTSAEALVVVEYPTVVFVLILNNHVFRDNMYIVSALLIYGFRLYIYLFMFSGFYFGVPF